MLSVTVGKQAMCLFFVKNKLTKLVCYMKENVKFKIVRNEVTQTVWKHWNECRMKITHEDNIWTWGREFACSVRGKIRQLYDYHTKEDNAYPYSNEPFE